MPIGEGRTILAIESSCDETAAAVLTGDELRSNVIAGQDVHARWGGVVPELASRAHQENIVPVVHQALEDAGIDRHELDAIAFTQGPGLMGALLVGTCFARSMARSLEIPMVAVDHIRAHALAHFIKDATHRPVPVFPYLNLTVSGGHTLIVVVHAADRMEVLGTTLDDAAGEAFDKGAKLMGLPYPGGPEIDRLASAGDPKAFRLSKPRVEGMDMSFSGVKSSFRQLCLKLEGERPGSVALQKNDLAAVLQHTILNILLGRVEMAVESTGITQVAISGGVSANSGLRARLSQLAERKGWSVFIPPMVYCTDNAAMIGIAGQFLLDAGITSPLDTVPLARTL